MARKKKIVEATDKEKRQIQGRLEVKYPQMYEHSLTKAEEKQLSRVSPADRKALLNMIGKKLKKIYGGY